MKKYIFFILVGLLPLQALKSQEFSFHSMSPFGIQTMIDSSNIGLKYMFIDFDGDSDLDLIMMGYDSLDTVNPLSYRSFYYFVDYQENTGDRKHPVFADRKPLIEDFPFIPGLFVPAIGDLDGDGRVDMVVSAEIDSFDTQHLLYYHQRSDGTFDIQRMDDLGIDPLLPKSSFVPELTDLDKDGDLDILMTGNAPAFFDTTGESSVTAFRYAKNIGNASNPLFLSWFENPFGLVTIPEPQSSVTGDIDHDGDMDILAISEKDSLITFCFYRNAPGSNGKPAFQQPIESPFGLPQPEAEALYFLPSLADLDGDNDLDLIFLKFDSLFNAGLFYYENTLSTSGIKRGAEYSDQISVIPNPARDELTIVNSTSLGVADVTIFNNSGKLIRTVQDNLQRPLAINDLPNGLYILRIRLSNGKEVIKKVVVIHE